MHDVEREVVDADVFGRAADVWYDERHEELLHWLLEGVVFEGGGSEFHDSRLRVLWMNFKTRGDNINNLLHFGAIKEKGAVL